MAAAPKDVLTQRVRDRLRGLMKEHGVTQAMLIRASKQRQQDVSRFFRGQMVYPPLDFLDSLAAVFQLRAADLLNDDTPRPAIKSDEVSVLAAWRSMPPGKAREGILALMRGRTGRREDSA